MSKVRVLVGTHKGAFVLTSDGRRERWDISGPQFAGWDVYHLKGSPADPNRLYASQCTGWFGQLIQSSHDGGKTWKPVGNQFAYDGVPALGDNVPGAVSAAWAGGRRPGRTSGTTVRRIPGSSRESGISSRR